MATRRLFEELAARLRNAREARNLSLQTAADRAGVSRRFLVEVEGGRTNPSIGKLAALADAYGIPLRDLCDLPTGSAPPHRIALIGLRGAGKSTVGRILARELEVDFTELDDLIEELAGLTVKEVFALHGPEGYRRLEREALEAWLKRHGSGVLAVPGGIVTSKESYDRLRSTCRSIWLQASAEEHWNRVVSQGDLRPMRGQPKAMEQLIGLLRARESLYRLADIRISTSGREPAECARRALEALD